MRKKKATVSKTPKFELSQLKPESNITVVGYSEETQLMFDKLNELEVGQSYKMPMDYLRIYNNAKTAHKRINGKIFIMRKLDKYNIRTWRMKEGTILRTPRGTRKK